MLVMVRSCDLLAKQLHSSFSNFFLNSERNRSKVFHGKEEITMLLGETFIVVPVYYCFSSFSSVAELCVSSV